MNTLPRLRAAALLVAFMPLVAAQEAARKAPPDAASAAGQPRDESAKTGNAKAARLRQGLGQKVEAIRTYSAERRDEAVANARRAVDELDRQMQTLQEQMDQRRGRMGQAARARSQATMADLRKRRNALAEWVGGMRHGSTAAWAEVRGGFIKSYHELAVALRKARVEFEQEQKQRAVDKAARDDQP